MLLVTLLMSLIAQADAASVNRHRMISTSAASAGNSLQANARAGFFIPKLHRISATHSDVLRSSVKRSTEAEEMSKRAAEESNAESHTDEVAFDSETFFYKPPKGADKLTTDSVNSSRFRRGTGRIRHTNMKFVPGFFYQVKPRLRQAADQEFITRGHGKH